MLRLEQVASTHLPGAASWDSGAELRCADLIQRLLVGGFHRPVLFCSSPSRFWEALWSCWRLGLCPMIPPDIQKGNLRLMASLGADVLLTDHADGKEVLPELVLALEPTTAHLPASKVLHSESIALSLFTSGSTGERKLVEKSFAQLGQEASILQAQWGKECEGKPIFATVSHQHIYGLLFTILWPVLAQQKVAKARIFHWDELPSPAPLGGVVVVSSPTHLNLLAQGNPISAWDSSVIFSSGGPLSFQSAQGVFSRVGIWVREIYGSTETGGIAWRTQEAADTCYWTPQPGVQILIDDLGNLLSASPWSQWPSLHESGDRAEKVDGGFRLCGRSDRIAKVFEKRVNLGEMERILQASSLLSDARIIAPNGGDHDSHLWCAAAPSELGRTLTRSQMIQAMKECLRPHFEAALIPRHWYIGDLPFNSQGKLTMEDLHKAVQSQAYVLQPEFRSLTASATSIEADILVPANYYYLQGHFPGVPIVPGICQLHWVIDLVKKHWQGSACRIEGKVKYSGILTPERLIHLSIELLNDGARFSLSDQTRKYSSGRIRVH